MAEFAILLKLTEQGRPRLENIPEFLADLESALEPLEGRAQAYLATGEFDFLLIGTVPDGERVMHLAVGLARGGEVSPTSVTLYSADYLTSHAIMTIGQLRKSPPGPIG